MLPASWSCWELYSNYCPKPTPFARMLASARSATCNLKKILTRDSALCEDSTQDVGRFPRWFPRERSDPESPSRSIQGKLGRMPVQVWKRNAPATWQRSRVEIGRSSYGMCRLAKAPKTCFGRSTLPWRKAANPSWSGDWSGSAARSTGCGWKGSCRSATNTTRPT